MCQGRNSRLLPKHSVLNLGRAGWIPNLITVAWAIVEIIFYDLPTELPATAGNMST